MSFRPGETLATSGQRQARAKIKDKINDINRRFDCQRVVKNLEVDGVMDVFLAICLTGDFLLTLSDSSGSKGSMGLVKQLLTNDINDNE